MYHGNTGPRCVHQVVQEVEACQFESVTRENQSVVNKETTNRTHDLSVVNKRSPTDLMTW